MRKPSTPRSSQKRMASKMAALTSGLRQLRSGCWRRKEVQVVLAGGGIERPGGSAEVAHPVVGHAAAGSGVMPEIPVAVRVVARGAALKEPGMLVRAVIGNEVEDEPKAARRARPPRAGRSRRACRREDRRRCNPRRHSRSRPWARDRWGRARRRRRRARRGNRGGVSMAGEVRRRHLPTHPERSGGRPDR